jgi:hypothetical protein
VEAPHVARLCCGVCGRDGFVGERGLRTHRAKNPVSPPPARFPTHATRYPTHAVSQTCSDMNFALDYITFTSHHL